MMCKRYAMGTSMCCDDSGTVWITVHCQDGTVWTKNMRAYDTPGEFSDWRQHSLLPGYEDGRQMPTVALDHA